MKYKIVTLKESDLEDFNDKIIQVIDSKQIDVHTGTDYLGTRSYSKEWQITCLVEVKTR